jgi:predicted nuclease with TOPRIM domain
MGDDNGLPLEARVIILEKDIKRLEESIKEFGGILQKVLELSYQSNSTQEKLEELGRKVDRLGERLDKQQDDASKAREAPKSEPKKSFLSEEAAYRIIILLLIIVAALSNVSPSLISQITK